MSGPLDASVTLEDVFAVVVAKRVPLAPELAGYLVLEIAEHADPHGGDVDPRAVFVSEEGTVALVKPRLREAVPGDAEGSIRSALARLLDASGSQTPALVAAGKRKSGGGLPALAEELEAALIPVNRAAGRRALARLAREVKRITQGVGRNALPSTADAAAAPSRRAPTATQPLAIDPLPSPMPPPARAAAPSFGREEEPTTTRGLIPDEVLRLATPQPMDTGEMPTTQFEPLSRSPSPSQADVDSLIDAFAVSSTGDQDHSRELKAMAGLDPTPALPPQIARRMETREVDLSPARPNDASARTARPAREPAGFQAHEEDLGGDPDVDALLELGGRSPSARPPPAAASRPRPGRQVDPRQLPTGPSEVRRPHASSLPAIQPRRRGGAVVVLLAVAFIAVGAYLVMVLRPPASVAPAPTASSAAPAASAAPPCKGSLIVTDVPSHAEVLLRAGQAPIDVPSMPVGARLEFVATAEGYAPKRLVVPAGAGWDNGADGKPRFEAAVQLDKSKAHPGTNDPWPASEPGSSVGGEGAPGTVHVVATPRGAEIWMLVAIGPEARIDQLHCAQDFDVLLAGPTTYRKRLHVASSDFVADDSPAAASASKTPVRVARFSAK